MESHQEIKADGCLEDAKITADNEDDSITSLPVSPWQFKQRMCDFRRCVRNLRSFTDNQAVISAWDEDTLGRIAVKLLPSGGPYQGGQFDFEIILETGYPESPPQINCLTPIYHPNIDCGICAYVCMSLLGEHWSDTCGLEDIIQGLLMLLYYPNREDALNFDVDVSETEEDFLTSVRRSLKGQHTGTGLVRYDSNLPTADTKSCQDSKEILVKLDSIFEEKKLCDVTISDIENALADMDIDTTIESTEQDYNTRDNSIEASELDVICGVDSEYGEVQKESNANQEKDTTVISST